MNYLYFCRLNIAAVLICLCFGNNAFAQTPAEIEVYVTVDWEGGSLEQDNIEAMQVFRKKYADIPMVHFLNPVYFLRLNQHTEQVFKTIHSTVLPNDEHGLHLHGWKSLVQQCGVDYKPAPSFAAQDERCEIGDCGYSVSLEYAYSQPELNRLIACSADLLVQQGFNRPRSFRAGGWQQGGKLTAALKENQFLFDSSRTDSRLLTTKWDEKSNLVQMVQSLHPASSPLDQPYLLSGKLIEFPNNASLADYTSADQILIMFKQLIAHKKPVMVLGFHQETAFSYLGRLDDAIPEMQKAARASNVFIQWKTFEGRFNEKQGLDSSAINVERAKDTN
ncbi:MAG: hypothetical protein ACT4OH_06885 [Methylophilaceae bacterium]